MDSWIRPCKLRFNCRFSFNVNNQLKTEFYLNYIIIVIKKKKYNYQLILCMVVRIITETYLSRFCIYNKAPYQLKFNC